MQEIILITDKYYGIDQFFSILKEKGLKVKKFADNNQEYLEIVINNFEDSLQLEEAPEVEQFHDPVEFSRITKIIPDPHFYFLHFKDIEAVKIIIKYLANRDNVFVDNDHGTFAPGKEFISILTNKPNWNWFKENK